MRKKIKEIQKTQDARDPELSTVTLSSCDTGLQEGRQLDFKTEILNSHEKKKIQCLTDTGASAKSFINANFAKYQKLPLMTLIKPLKLRLTNGDIDGEIIHATRIIISFEDHIEELLCLIIFLTKFDLILDMS